MAGEGPKLELSVRRCDEEVELGKELIMRSSNEVNIACTEGYSADTPSLNRADISGMEVQMFSDGCWLQCEGIQGLEDWLGLLEMWKN